MALAMKSEHEITFQRSGRLSNEPCPGMGIKLTLSKYLPLLKTMLPKPAIALLNSLGEMESRSLIANILRRLFSVAQRFCLKVY